MVMNAFETRMLSSVQNACMSYTCTACMHAVAQYMANGSEIVDLGAFQRASLWSGGDATTLHLIWGGKPDFKSFVKLAASPGAITIK